MKLCSSATPLPQHHPPTPLPTASVTTLGLPSQLALRYHQHSSITPPLLNYPHSPTPPITTHPLPSQLAPSQHCEYRREHASIAHTGHCLFLTITITARTQTIISAPPTPLSPHHPSPPIPYHHSSHPYHHLCPPHSTLPTPPITTHPLPSQLAPKPSS